MLVWERCETFDEQRPLLTPDETCQVAGQLSADKRGFRERLVIETTVLGAEPVQALVSANLLHPGLEPLRDGLVLQDFIKYILDHILRFLPSAEITEAETR